MSENSHYATFGNGDRMGSVLLSSEFVTNFGICNRYPFRHKHAFYAIKNCVLRQFGRRDGYDLQVFWKYRQYWAQSYHYDMQWDYYESTPPERWLSELADKWNSHADYDLDRSPEVFYDGLRMGDENHLVRCVSKHSHILERWVLQTESGARVFHKPVDEFHYLAYPNGRRGVLVKYSDCFGVFASECKQRVGLLHDDKCPKELNPLESFKWMIRWCRERREV